MNNHIKLPYTLADIDNPHPVLLVGENHSFFSHSLMTMRSLPHLKKKNYSHFIAEYAQTEEPIFTLTKQQIIFARDIQFAGPASTEEMRSLLGMFIQYEVDANKLSYIYADHSVKHSKKYMEDTNSYENQDVSETLNAIGNQAIQELRLKSLFSFLKRNKRPSVSVIVEALNYASYGPKTFNHFQETSPLSPEMKEKVMKAGRDMKEIYKSQIKKCSDSYCLETRNMCMAKNIADIHTKLPKAKMITHNGFSHIDDGTAPDTFSNYSVLPEILKNEYKIDTTTALFVENDNIEKIKNFFSIQGVDPKYLCLEEVLPEADVRFQTNSLEAYYALTGETVTEGIHKITDHVCSKIDYAIVMPNLENTHVFNNAKVKAKHLLNLV